MATKLRVGENIYYVDKQRIVEKFPNSLFKDIFKPCPIRIEEYFIDRDGEFFKYILYYLRSYPNFTYPMDPEAIAKLHKEAVYYKLETLSNFLLEKSSTYGILLGNDFVSSVTMLVKYTSQNVYFIFSFPVEDNEFVKNAPTVDQDIHLIYNIKALNKRGYTLERIDNISDNQKEKKLYTFKLQKE